MTKSEPIDILCTDHDPANLSKYDDPCDVNANKQRANDRRDDQPLILDRKRNTGYCVLRQYRSKLRARKRLCGVTPTPPLPKAGCHSAVEADTVKLLWGGAIKPPVIKSCVRRCCNRGPDRHRILASITDSTCGY